MFDKHKHDWDLIDKKLVKSGWTSLIESAERQERPISMESLGSNPSFWTDRYVLTFKCHCGEIKVVTK